MHTVRTRLRFSTSTLEQYRDQAFVLNLSGAGKTAAAGLTLMGVDKNGDTFFT